MALVAMSKEAATAVASADTGKRGVHVRFWNEELIPFFQAFYAATPTDQVSFDLLATCPGDSDKPLGTVAASLKQSYSAKIDAARNSKNDELAELAKRISFVSVALSADEAAKRGVSVDADGKTATLWFNA
jgi:hypothetical protein